MNTFSAELRAQVLNAIAHPNRIRIIEAIRKGRTCNCEIAPELGLEQSNLSRHLKILVTSGVLESWKDGPRVNYRVADGGVYELIDTAGEIAKATLIKKTDILHSG